MSKLTQEQFDRTLVKHLNLIAKRASAVSKLGGRNIELVSETKQAKIVGLLRSIADKIDGTWNEKRVPKARKVAAPALTAIAPGRWSACYLNESGSG